jgi:HEAT repeat protein
MVVRPSRWRRSDVLRRRFVLLGMVCLVATASDALAQSRTARPQPHAAPPSPPPASTLRARFGLEAATRLLRSADPDERLRGVERAAATHTPEALALLQRAVSAGVPGAFDPRAPIDGVARTDPRALLAAVRGLAGWADHESARSALAAVVSGPTQSFATRVPSMPSRDPVAEDGEGAARILLARQEAAIALADSGGPLALEALMALARSGGPGQGAALDALALHPPVWPVLGGVTLTTPATIALASAVGDLRSLDAIEGALRASDAGLRAAALAALGAAGDTRCLQAARAALRDPDPRARLAAAEALVRLGAPDAADSVAALVGDDATVRGALRLAQEVQGESVTRAAAARAVASADREVRSAAVVALGRQSSAGAVSALLSLAGDPVLGGDAAYALARSPSPAAMSALATLAGGGDTRRLAGRAYFVRRMARGERTAQLDGLLASLAASPDARDRAVGVQALVALGERSVEPALRDVDPRVRRAAAMGYAGVRGRTAEALIGALGGETDETTRQVLAFGWVDEAAAGGAPTSALVDRAESGGADAPLAALALARRVDESTGARVDALLASHDPLLRAHAAMGLGEAAVEDATGRLARAYAWEPDAEVRRAIVRALSLRDSGATTVPSRRETLEWAARLDPDRIVRRLATHALDGSADSPGRAPGREVAWLRLVPAAGTAPPAGQTAALVGADGLARPIAFDDDGYALVPVLSPGEARLRLAPRLPAYESQGQ